MTLDIKNLIKILKQNKYTNIKINSGNRLAVLTEQNRIEVLQHIQKIFKKYGAIYNEKLYNISSVGGVEIKSFIISAKPINMQGDKRPGVENELLLIKSIKNFIRKNKKVNICFLSHKRKYEFKKIVGVKHTGKIVVARQKADLILVDHKGKIFPISLKKDNAAIWESADSYGRELAINCIEKLIKQKKVKMKKGSIWTLSPKVAIKANAQQSRDVIFGSDIRNNGIVVQKTFNKTDFHREGKTLDINCNGIIRNLNDLDQNHKVWFIVRRDKTRINSLFFPGLRIFAIAEKHVLKTYLRVYKP